MQNTSKPVYLKLRDIISGSNLDGEYQEGDMLPSVRAFASEQGANPLTVAKAYQGFQEDGLVTVKRGVGMFVARGAKAKLRDAQRKDFIDNVWPPVERQMKRLDINLDDLLSDA
jgi:GntR family transcriptional regulator